jgi:hypothetical protein
MNKYSLVVFHKCAFFGAYALALADTTAFCVARKLITEMPLLAFFRNVDTAWCHVRPTLLTERSEVVFFDGFLAVAVSHRTALRALASLVAEVNPCATVLLDIAKLHEFVCDMPRREMRDRTEVVD